MFKRRSSSNQKKTEPHQVVEPVAPAIERVVLDRDTLKSWYSEAFQERTRNLTRRLSDEVAQELLSEFDGELKRQVSGIDYQWTAGAESLRLEVAYLQERFGGDDLGDEIKRVVEAIVKLESELERSFTDEAVPLSRLLHLRSTQNDLKSYLRGLRFHADKASSLEDVEKSLPAPSRSFH